MFLLIVLGIAVAVVAVVAVALYGERDNTKR
jgi:hypothetical protein